jgi:hypothetical protein
LTISLAIKTSTENRFRRPRIGKGFCRSQIFGKAEQEADIQVKIDRHTGEIVAFKDGQQIDIRRLDEFQLKRPNR